MIRSLTAGLFLSFALVALAPTPGVGADVHELVGAWARYSVEHDGVTLPRVDALVLSAPRLEQTPQGDALWFQLEAYWERTRVFAFAMLVSDVSFLDGGGVPTVHRYILYPEKGDPLEYVDSRTGRAYLPRLGLFEGLLPVAPAGSATPLFALHEFLGRTLTLEHGSAVGAKFLSSYSGHPVLALDDRVLVGNSRHFRDDGTGRVMDYTRIPPEPGDYTYVELTKADYDEMIAAGFNMFRLPARHLDHVMARPVFFLVHEGIAAHPELFYRSNYWGGVMYIDEPDIHAGFEGILSPEEAGDWLKTFTADVHQGSSIYGSRYLESRLTLEGWDLGSRVDLVETEAPTWVGHTGTGWYQMEAGVRSLIQEGRVKPVNFAAKIQDRFDVDFPDDPEICIRLQMASATGAAEYFDGDWGVSVFGQMEDEAADLLFALAYERGARYFWLWTSDYNHHVPHARQLELAANFRDWRAYEAGDRPRESQPVVAISVPWGYNWGNHNLQGPAPGQLWWGSGIMLDDLNEAGVPYGDVLAAAYRTFVERVDVGEEVDLVYLRSGETLPAGDYDTVYHVLPTGWVQSGTTSSPEVTHGAGALRVRATPNPARGGTGLRFEVSRPAVTRMHVYDAAGRRIRTVLQDATLPEGSYNVWWNGRDDAGERVASGVYFVRATIGQREGTRKIVLLQ